MLELQCRLDSRRIRPGVATELKCELELWPSAELAPVTGGPAMITSICLVVDCSASMTGPKAEAAIAAAHLLVDTIDDRHRISLVGFATSHWVLVDNACPAETGREPIKHQIDRLRNLIRGGTNLAEGIRRGLHVLHRQQAHANVIVVLTDGEADSREDAVQAGVEASDHGVQVFAVGIGDDFKADDLLKVVTPSNGAVLGERDVDRLESAFGVLLHRFESFVATNVQLVVSLHQGVHPGSLYKTRPERTFIGHLSPGDRTIRLHVGNLERGQTYAFLLALTPPAGPAGEVEIARAVVRYDVPALRLRDVQKDVAITVAYDERPEQPNAGVTDAYRRAELAALVDELAESEARSNTVKSTELLHVLLRRSEAQGDTRIVEELRGVTPPIPQAKLNALVLAATARSVPSTPLPPPATPPPPPRATPSPAIEPPAPQPPLHDLVLVEAGSSVIELMRELRELTGLGLAEVHEIIKGAPATIIALPAPDATAAKQRLEAAGARISIELKHR